MAEISWICLFGSFYIGIDIDIDVEYVMKNVNLAFIMFTVYRKMFVIYKKCTNVNAEGKKC